MTPTVTGLREKQRGRRVAVELDGRVWRVLPTEAVVRAGLVVGRPLDRPRARELSRAVRRAKALAAATRSLEARQRSRQALEQRLARAGHPAAAREDALATLGRAGILDDARLAESRAGLLARRGYGDAAIQADLMRQQLAVETVAVALAGLEPELDRARQQLEGRHVTPGLLRRLAGRGFSDDTLEEVAAAFAQEA